MMDDAHQAMDTGDEEHKRPLSSTAATAITTPNAPQSAFSNHAANNNNSTSSAAAAASGMGHSTINININTPGTHPTLININVTAGGGPAKLVLPPPRNPRDLFDILRSLRKTIFGHLCLGQVKGTSTQVAIKLSELTKMSEIHTHENPRRECDLLARVAGHPHIVTLLGEYECDRYHWAVYELVENGDFFAYVQTHGKILEAQARAFFRQLCSGIYYMHSKNLVHLDLKPDNILFTANREIKICDFGMARDLNANKRHEDMHKPTYFRGQVGTLLYMAPEVFASTTFEPRLADVYSMGVILYIMLTGAPPYELPTKSDPRFVYIMTGRMLEMLRHFKYLDNMSLEAVDLLQRILTLPEKRLTLEQVMTHPWVRGERLTSGPLAHMEPLSSSSSTTSVSSSSSSHPNNSNTSTSSSSSSSSHHHHHHHHGVASPSVAYATQSAPMASTYTHGTTTTAHAPPSSIVSQSSSSSSVASVSSVARAQAHVSPGRHFGPTGSSPSDNT